MGGVRSDPRVFSAILEPAWLRVNDQRNKKDLGTYSSICNILDHLRLNALCYADEVDNLIDKYLINFKCKNELKIGACIYYLISSSGLTCQLHRFSGFVCLDINDSKHYFS